MNTFCPYCQTNSPLYLQSKDYNRRITGDRFKHNLCPNCGLIFIGNLPANLSKYYPDNYYKIPDSIEELKRKSKNRDKYKIDTVRRFLLTGQLLEIGPSFGGFCYLAKNAGFRVDAIEMNSECCKFLNETVGINAIKNDNPIDALSNMKFYDVIVLWHVIEHLTDLWKILEVASKRLNSNGIIALATPNPDAFQFKLMGRFWPHLDAPRHIMLIPRDLLTKKFQSLGMKEVYRTTNDSGSCFEGLMGWRKLLHRKFPKGNIKEAFGLIGTILWFLLRPIERIEGKGSAYTMVFRKID